MKVIELVKTIVSEYVDIELITSIFQTIELNDLKVYEPELVYNHPHFSETFKLLYEGKTYMMPYAYTELEVEKITINDNRIVVLVKE